MICGLKWKTCNCPWFNYNQVENDRLNHFNIPQIPAYQQQRLPRNFNEEVNGRRLQERDDEELARQLQNLDVDNDDFDRGGPGGIFGIGNAAGHFLNQDYIRVATGILGGAYGQAAAAANYVMGGRRREDPATDPPPPPPPPPPQPPA